MSETVTFNVSSCGIPQRHNVHLHEVRTGPEDFETHYCRGEALPVAEEG